jgi:hypothetical protein
MILSLALLLAAADPPTLYQRIRQHYIADPAAFASLGRPAPQMHEVDWLVGTWDVSAVVDEQGAPPSSGTSVIAPQFGGAWLEVRDTYPGALNLVYLGYSTTEGRWIVVALDNLMNASRSSAPAWTDGRIAFEGDYLILGMPAHLRQTIERQSEDAFTVVTEELVGARWSRVASRYYRRHPAH